MAAMAEIFSPQLSADTGYDHRGYPAQYPPAEAYEASLKSRPPSGYNMGPMSVPPPSTSEPPSAKQVKKRWNPILGAYVTQAVSETDIVQEARLHDLENYHRSMGKVIKREGSFNPVFWRHRVTGEHAGNQNLSGRKRLGKDAHAVADVLRVECGAPSPTRVEPTFNEKQKDHVRALLNHDELRPESHRSYQRTYRQVDHVKSLLHAEPASAEESRLMHSFGRKPHHERKGTRDVCVANLLNEDRAKQLPEQGLSKQRSALGEAMRSGVGLRMVLNPGLPAPADDPFTARSAYSRQSARSEPGTPGSPPRSAPYVGASNNAPYGTFPPQPTPGASPSRPPTRPEWLDHDSNKQRVSVSAPPRPTWLTHDPKPPGASPSKPYSRPAYMDYTAVTSELPPRDTKLRR